MSDETKGRSMTMRQSLVSMPKRTYVPLGERAPIARALRKHGLPVTDDAIREVYAEATKFQAAEGGEDGR